jgi:hypothetical protein
LKGGWQNNRRMGMHERHRFVENNIIVNNTFHPHVWFKTSNEVLRHNIVSSGYLPINIKVWSEAIDYNVFPDSASLKAAWSRGTDKNSVCEDLFFVDAQNGDFRLRDGSIAFSIGFKNFAMDSFGVVSPRLKMLAKKVSIPSMIAISKLSDDEVIDFMGAKVKNLSTLGERSATGMDNARGVIVIEVTPGSSASKFLQANDVILRLNQRPVDTLRDLLEARISIIGTNTEMVIFHNQKEVKKWIELKDKN